MKKNKINCSINVLALVALICASGPGYSNENEPQKPASSYSWKHAAGAVVTGFLGWFGIKWAYQGPKPADDKPGHKKPFPPYPSLPSSSATLFAGDSKSSGSTTVAPTQTRAHSVAQPSGLSRLWNYIASIGAPTEEELAQQRIFESRIPRDVAGLAAAARVHGRDPEMLRQIRHRLVNFHFATLIDHQFPNRSATPEQLRNAQEARAAYVALWSEGLLYDDRDNCPRSLTVLELEAHLDDIGDLSPQAVDATLALADTWAGFTFLLPSKPKLAAKLAHIQKNVKDPEKAKKAAEFAKKFPPEEPCTIQ